MLKLSIITLNHDLEILKNNLNPGFMLNMIKKIGAKVPHPLMFNVKFMTICLIIGHLKQIV